MITGIPQARPALPEHAAPVLFDEALHTCCGLRHHLICLPEMSAALRCRARHSTTQDSVATKEKASSTPTDCRPTATTHPQVQQAFQASAAAMVLRATLPSTLPSHHFQTQRRSKFVLIPRCCLSAV